MIFSDRDILKKIASGDIVITSPDNGHEANINASSVDLRLGRFFKKYKLIKSAVLDPHDPKTLIDATVLIESKDEEDHLLFNLENLSRSYNGKIKLATILLRALKEEVLLGVSELSFILLPALLMRVLRAQLLLKLQI